MAWEITYIDGLGFEETVETRQSTIEFTSANSRQLTQTEIDDLTNEGDNFRVVILAADTVGIGSASFAITGGADMARFSISGITLSILTSAVDFQQRNQALK